MNNLNTKKIKQEEIKQYVIRTINTGNKERIQKVLKRYWEYLNENNEKNENKKDKSVQESVYKSDANDAGDQNKVFNEAKQIFEQSSAEHDE